MIVELCIGLQEAGFEPIVGIIKYEHENIPPLYYEAQTYNIPTLIFNCTKKLDLKTLRAIKNYVSSENIEILHTHGYKEDIYAFLVSEVKSKIATNHLWKNSSWLYRVYSFIDALVLMRYPVAVAVSENVVKQMNRYFITNVQKINNGINVGKYDVPIDTELKESLGLEESFVIGMISSLTPEKNHCLALAALKEVTKHHHNVKLLIVGDGFFRSQILRKINEYRLQEHVILLGVRNDIVNILSIIDIFLMPSKTEGCPMALIEAMASGKPIVASPVGEIPEMLNFGKAGILIEHNQLESIVNSLNRLYHDSKLMEEFGNNAKRQAAKKFDIKIMTNNYIKVYRNL